jgi:hypothetical protein
MFGRLQTDADRTRVIGGLGEDKKSAVAKLLKRIAPRWFVVREPNGELSILEPRWRCRTCEGP